MAVGEIGVDAGSVTYSGAIIAAAGTTQGAATAITTDTVQVSGAAGQTGVILPASPGYARIFVDFTGGIATLSVYPPSGGQINALGANNPTSVATGGQVELWSVKSDNSQWYVR